MMFFGVRFCAVNNMQYFYLLNSACPPKRAFFLAKICMRGGMKLN